MPIVNPDTEEQSQIRDSLFGLNEYISEEHYTRWLSPGEFVPGSGASLIEIDELISAIELPDVADAYACAQIRKPEYWVNGYLLAEVWYTKEAATSGDFVLKLLVNAYEEGGTIQSEVVIDETNILTPNQSEVHLLEVDSGSNKVLTPDRLITVTIDRLNSDGKDTNTAELSILGVQLVYVPANPQ